MDGKSVARLRREPLDISERALDMEQVSRLWLQGQKGEIGITKISKQLGLSRAYVKKLIDEFVLVFRSDEGLRQRTKEIVGEFDHVSDQLKAEAFRLLADAEDAGDLKTRASVIASISQMEARRVDTLQKSGLLANMDMAEQIAENEAKQQALIKIIKDVTAKYPELKVEIARRLSELNGRVEPVEVEVVDEL